MSIHEQLGEGHGIYTSVDLGVEQESLAEVGAAPGAQRGDIVPPADAAS